MKIEIGKKYKCRNIPEINYMRIVDVHVGDKLTFRGESDKHGYTVWYNEDGKLLYDTESPFDLVEE